MNQFNQQSNEARGRRERTTNTTTTTTHSRSTISYHSNAFLCSSSHLFKKVRVRFACAYELAKRNKHGDKTPDKLSVYPNDPYKNEEYHPYGYGQLTNNGIETAENLGRALGKKYQGLLGEIYRPGVLDPWTSILDRCKATLELVLAGLFPDPKNKQESRPIAYNSSTKMFLAVLINPIALKVYEDFIEGQHGRVIMESRADVLRYMEEHSGLAITTIRHAAILANALISQHNMGLSLPDWTKKIWPDAMMEIIDCEHDILTSTALFKFFSVGMLLEKMIEDSKSKIEDKSTCKMHLYSGHDVTLAVLLRCLGVKNPKSPSYGANLIFELHKVDGTFGYKIYYQWSLKHEAELLAIDGHGTFCPFEDFVRLNQEVLDQKRLNPDF